METDLFSNINNNYNRFSKGQKLLANYILNNYDKAVFLTAAKLGKIVGVSESTVVRFAILLGYDGYPKLQRALEEMVKNKLNSVQRMEVTFDRMNQEQVLKSVLHSDAEKIRITSENIDEKAFEEAVNTILEAKTIYIIGVRSSAPLASFLHYYFNIIFENVKLISTNSSSDLFQQLYRISDRDVIIGISFPRYSASTLKPIGFANSQGAHIITITDSYDSPLTANSKCNLIARSDMASVVDSLVAPLSVINALIVAICLRKQDQVIGTFAFLEKIWSQNKVYQNIEDNSVESGGSHE